MFFVMRSIMDHITSDAYLIMPQAATNIAKVAGHYMTNEHKYLNVFAVEGAQLKIHPIHAMGLPGADALEWCGGDLRSLMDGLAMTSKVGHLVYDNYSPKPAALERKAEERRSSLLPDGAVPHVQIELIHVETLHG